MKMNDWLPLTLEAEDTASFWYKILGAIFMIVEWTLVVFVTVFFATVAIKLGWSIK